jgi:hypothetical protein
LSPSCQSNGFCDLAFGFWRVCETMPPKLPHAEDQAFRG